MPQLVGLTHQTHYRYAGPVFLLPQLIRLSPAPHGRTPVRDYHLRIEPAGHFLNHQFDSAGNHVARIVFPQRVDHFSITVDLTADLSPWNPFDFFLEPEASTLPLKYDAAALQHLSPYLQTRSFGRRFDGFVAQQQFAGEGTVAALIEITRRVRAAVNYLQRHEPGVQTPEQTLELASGSCRDSAWLLVHVLRTLGLAARFVSGYLIQLLGADPSAPNDRADLHAWAEVFLPGAGWIGMDATSGLLCGEGHLPLAFAAEPMGAAPVSGTFLGKSTSAAADFCGAGGRSDEFEFSVSVHRMTTHANVTHPISDSQWQQVDSLGQQIDAELKLMDVRLTMGGEPTFVSTTDRNAPEWNIAALGGEKYKKGAELIARFRDRFAPAGLIHDGQGKWYPGETGPRWALGLYWRKDGQPVWTRADLLADLVNAETPERPGNLFPGTRGGTDTNGPRKQVPWALPEAAKLFAQVLSKHLAVDPQFIIAGYEDAWFTAWREHQSPANVDPLDPRLRNSIDRQRLTQLDEQGFDQLVGYALPIRAELHEGKVCWLSGGWRFRRERMYLGTASGPMGQRLPLDAMEWVKPEEFPAFFDRDPGEEKSALPSRAKLAEPASASDPAIVRTAVCVEARGSALRVFLPPLETLEAYLDLIAKLEAAAAELNQPIIIEGYGPPIDSRLNVFKVTPDPGVIEINTHPANDWQELSHNITTIYEQARACGLTAEKFQYDGQHVGTGGGNHVLLGGPSVTDSPVLRRPDLLGSLLRYWQNHPSLSYLFSGLFVGPTSQAPRVDEARTDQIHELEVALKQMPPPGSEDLPWTIDRLLRNILVDSTGNTHRAEFCIDKLYTPGTIMGRLGLLELRALEMPPHERMCLAQQLLIRALVARFWKTPYSQPLIRWGTTLHDRFLLPTPQRQDFQRVIDELNTAGYPMDSHWFDAQFEFRFPLIGRVELSGGVLELRKAIEPWPVLAEDGTAGATSRITDSTMARVEVRLVGVAPTSTLLCNGLILPLQPGGVADERLLGVRFRAWPAPNGLHPTIKPHVPLRFDLIDTGSQRSLGGCTYHTADPAGRFYDALPKDAREAETRRGTRFVPHGAQPKTLAPKHPAMSPDFPTTLDLRIN